MHNITTEKLNLTNKQLLGLFMCLHCTVHNCCTQYCRGQTRDLRSFQIQFDFESNFRFGIRFVVMIRFEIVESSAPSIVLCKETIGGG